MCFNKARGHTKINSAEEDGEDEDKYRINNKSVKLSDEEAITLSWKQTTGVGWRFTVLKNLPLKLFTLLLGTSVQQRRNLLRMLDMSIRDFVCAGEDKGIILWDVNRLWFGWCATLKVCWKSLRNSKNTCYKQKIQKLEIMMEKKLLCVQFSTLTILINES